MVGVSHFLLKTHGPNSGTVHVMPVRHPSIGSEHVSTYSVHTLLWLNISFYNIQNKVCYINELSDVLNIDGYVDGSMKTLSLLGHALGQCYAEQCWEMKVGNFVGWANQMLVEGWVQLEALVGLD